MSISVCIATYRRPELLQQTLNALAAQTVRAEEIIVSDAGGDSPTADLLARLAQDYDQGRVVHCPTSCRALPWQRWWSFSHSTQPIVLFLDDDICLRPNALETLLHTYGEQRGRKEALAGVGFLINYGTSGKSLPKFDEWKERWLGTRGSRPGIFLAGGVATPYNVVPGSVESVRVQRLSGGAMSFRREVLQCIGLLDPLVRLYEQGIGRGEDSVLSYYCSQHGSFTLIVLPMADHLNHVSDQPHPYSHEGWNGGLTATWGIAHTLRWTASDLGCCRRTWWRFVALELLRASYHVIKQPWRIARWTRLAGGCWGALRAWAGWHRIPRYAQAGNWKGPSASVPRAASAAEAARLPLEATVNQS